MNTDLLISCDSLAQQLQSKRAPVILDCRFSLADFDLGAQQYAQGHIQSAFYADLNHDLAGSVGERTGRHPLPNSETFVSKLLSWGIAPHTHVVVYDAAGGAMAARAWWMMSHWMDMQNVQLLDGGYPTWLAADLPVSTDVPTKNLIDDSKNTFRPNNDQIVLVEELLSEKLCVIDARSEARFNGESEPIDTVAGHIPGALNIPFDGNLSSETGLFRAPDELSRRFAALPGKNSIVQMCGSGVTACHNMLAMQLIGLNPGRLYVGSWSEWITDPNRAIALAGKN